jgi:hypothetical protein
MRIRSPQKSRYTAKQALWRGLCTAGIGALTLLPMGCGQGASGDHLPSAKETQLASQIPSWLIRYPPLIPYDPKFAANAQRVLLNAPLSNWIIASPNSFSSAGDCEAASHDLYVREYGRRTASLGLLMDAMHRKADTQDIQVLARRAAEDSGHDEQLDHARCINARDTRLTREVTPATGAMYLLIPPIEPDPGEDIRSVGSVSIHLRERFDAPLSRWFQLGAFDSEDACNEERHRRLSVVSDEAQRRPNESFTKSAAIVAAARCVAPSDQQLAAR